jgi:formylmethanofuran dehydrogenase subunit E
MNIRSHSFNEFLQMVKSFHGNVAPGVVLGGIMVQVARQQLPEEMLFDAISETRSCLPDAIQLLTPCTIGNGWLKVVNVGRFALALYDKYQGEGVRVFLDPPKVADWPEINAWYLKLSPKKEQDLDQLLEEIKNAGPKILGWERIKIRPQFLGKRNRDRIVICPLCREAYPSQDGGICRACQGEPLYLTEVRGEASERQAPFLQSLPVEQAVGRRALHDMTFIEPGASKGPAFDKGQVIGIGDLCRLHQMGRRHLYVMEENPVSPDRVHENDAALAIPLFLPRADFHKAMAILSDGPVFQVLPLRQPRVGILVTGTEVFMGLVENKFVHIISTKVEQFGGQVLQSLIVPDDRRAIGDGVKELLDCGIDLLVTTAGLSVDPDDVTRQGLADAGAEDMLYGAPILPGAMTLLARIGPVQVMGVPACALYFKTTSFDLLLPRLLAGLTITRHDLARMANGAFCLNCKVCTFPQKCPFGK